MVSSQSVYISTYAKYVVGQLSQLTESQSSTFQPVLEDQLSSTTSLLSPKVILLCNSRGLINFSALVDIRFPKKFSPRFILILMC